MKKSDLVRESESKNGTFSANGYLTNTSPSSHLLPLNKPSIYLATKDNNISLFLTILSLTWLQSFGSFTGAGRSKMASHKSGSWCWLLTGVCHVASKWANLVFFIVWCSLWVGSKMVKKETVRLIKI